MSDRPRGLRRAAAAAFLFLLSSGFPARAAERIELVSRALPGLISDSSGSTSFFPSTLSGALFQNVSADGRYVVFASSSPNLLPDQVDNNFGSDIYLYDRAEDELRLVSHTLAGADVNGNNASDNPSISADGRYVAFSSRAFDLTGGSDANNTEDVFVFDRDTGVVTLVSHAAGNPGATANNLSTTPTISADGNWIVFVSRAGNLIPGQVEVSGHDDVFLWERATNTVTLVSHSAASPTTDGNGSAFVTAINDDGSWVAYNSLALNLVGGTTDNNARTDVFLWERATNTNRLVSRSSDSATTTGNGTAQHVRLSADGSRLLFLSDGTNLIAGQSEGNTGYDAFLYSRDTGELTLVSHNAVSATTTGSGSSALFETAEISADGDWVAFASGGVNHVSGQVDSNNTGDVFLWSRASNTLQLVSRQVGTAATAGAGTNVSFNLDINADGSKVAYVSRLTNLIAGYTDPNVQADLFVFDRATGTNSLISGSGGSATAAANNATKTPVLSADGLWVAFVSNSGDLLSGVLDNNTADDVFLHDLAAGTTALLSRRDPGSPAATAGGLSIVPFVTVTSFVPWFSLSADGRYLAFQSTTDQLIPGQVKRSFGYDVFFYDRLTGEITLVSKAHGTTAVTGNGVSQNPVISADGRWVAYSSRATNLVAGQIDPSSVTDDVFLWDSRTGVTTLVSHTAASLLTAAGTSSLPQLSADGSAVAFLSNANNLVAGQSDAFSSPDVFLFDRATGAITLASHRNTNSTEAVGGCSEPLISADGQTVAFLSTSSTVIAGQSDAGGTDLFLWDRTNGAVTLVSQGTASATTAVGAVLPGMSADGNWLAFASSSTAVAPGLTDTNAQPDLFLWERATGTRRLVSHAATSATTTSNHFSQGVALSADGSRLAFLSRATNLVAGGTDTNNGLDAFVYERATGQIALASHTSAGATTTGNSSTSRVGISADGSRVTFVNGATNIVSGQIDLPTNGDVFLYQTGTGAVKLLSHLRTSELAAGGAEAGQLSADGKTVVFTSSNGAIVADDHNGRYDVFLWMEESATDLRITKTDGAESAIAGQAATYTIVATNLGPNGVTGAQIADNFPAALQGVSWTCVASGGATCAASGTGALDDAVHLPVGGIVTYTVNATIAADATGTLVNAATVVPPVGVVDPEPSDNTATDSTLLSSRAGLAVTLSDAPDPVERGAALTYTIEVANAGPSSAASVSVAQTLPAGVTFTSASGDGWSCGEAAGVVTCTRPSLAPGSAPALTVQVTAPVARGIATLTSGVAVSSATTDLDTTDNTAGAETAVPQPGITVTPASGLVTNEAGGVDTFTVVLDTAPLAGVTIAITSSDTEEGTADPASLTFTADDWSTPQTVTVTGADDILMDGDVAYTLQTGAASSTDAGYAGIDPADVAATNQDDASEGTYFTLTPCRLLDTRRPEDGPALTSGEVGILTVHGRCGVPATARAVVINATAVGGDNIGQVLVYPGDLAAPPTLGFLPVRLHRTTALFSVLPLAADGSGTLALEARLVLPESTPTVHVVVDVMGYFE